MSNIIWYNWTGLRFLSMWIITIFGFFLDDFLIPSWSQNAIIISSQGPDSIPYSFYIHIHSYYFNGLVHQEKLFPIYLFLASIL